MSYNWKCCSFYPNNFDASALHFGRNVCVPRSGYMCTSVGVCVYLGRSTRVPRSEYDDHQASLTRRFQRFDGTSITCSRNFYNVSAKLSTFCCINVLPQTVP